MIVDEMMTDEDCVIARWTFRGTCQDEFLGIPLTGEQASYSGITIFCVANGKLAEGGCCSTEYGCGRDWALCLKPPSS